MKTRSYSLCLTTSLFVSLLPILPSTAQTIPNPGFEADVFTVFPGYVSGNAPITGWTGNFPGSHGLNPSAGSPFADNGIIPQGAQVAFIQNNSNDSSLETTISGLTSGQTYQITFRANARNGNVPILNFLIDNNLLVNSNVTSVGVGNPYRWVSAYFTATASTALLTVKNTANTDNTIVIDDFTIAPTTSPWSYTAWTDEATTGVDQAYLYTHAFNFGSGATFRLNDVLFTGVAGGNPAVAGKLTTSGFDGVYPNDNDNNLIDASRPMANDFVYNGFPGNVTLSGLTPGKNYNLSLFSVGWEGTGSRWATFRSGDQQRSIDQDGFDNNNGIRVDYSYTADATGSLTVLTQPLSGNSFHLYGIANRETVISPVPIISNHPARALGFAGGTATFNAGAAGAPPLTYKWYRNNVEIPGETSSTLTLDLTSAATQAGYYTFRATNGTGSALSNAAFLEVYEPVAGALFSTGVDAAGVVLAPPEIDPHYTLVENPENVGVTDAFVQEAIPSPPWVANSLTSAWIGPRANTAGAAGPDPTVYLYRTILDLTGKPTTKGIITGSYASDNLGRGIQVNGTIVPGVPQSTNFGVLAPFRIRAESLPAGTLTAGVNNLDFEVVNAGAGYTGLRVEGLVYWIVPSGIGPVVITPPVGGTIVSGSPVTLSVDAYGSADLSYQWTRNNTNITGATASTYTIGSFSAAQNGDYAVKVTNPHGNVTSAIATLTASNVPPNITADPVGSDVAVGESVTFSFTAEGSTPFTYQWSFGNTDIPLATGPTYTISSATRANAGTYKVKVTNAYGDDTSAVATLGVFDAIPGIYNTGVDDTGAALADGDFDPHYILQINPGGTDQVPATVHSSTIYPIVAGPWLANNATSKWISSLADSVSASGLAFDGGEGPGTFVYRTTVDLTAFYLPSVKITGGWASDNLGLALRVNGTATGLVNTAQFPALTSFTISPANATFVQGVNTIDFLVQNQDVTAGPTGLRVDQLRALGKLLPPMPPLTITLNGSGQPGISFTGVAGTTYPIQRSTELSSGWSEIATVVAGPGGAVQYTDTNPPVGRAYYRTAVLVP
ncbi:MAG: immunoglobulin domain-containing protein [Verrucomicrobiota bacterium]